MKFVYQLYLHALIILIAVALYFNFKIYDGPELDNDRQTNSHVWRQLNYLEKEMHSNNLAERMQKTYPEGFVFSNAFYGLTWCQLAADSQRVESEVDREREMREAIWAFQQIDSQIGRRTFPEHQKGLKYGAFYHGWRNYLLGKIVQTFPNCPNELKTLHAQYSKEIASVFALHASPYPDSYPGQAWPCDASTCMASINLNTDEYKILSRQWIRKVKLRLIYPEGLVSSRWRRDGKPETEFIRGSSSMLNIRFLADIDIDFAEEQFDNFQPLFEKRIMGMPAIREFPENYEGRTNIDSGPVIMDVGFSATMCGIGTYKTMGREYKSAANNLFHSVHAFGLATNSGDETYYLMGKMPIADLFIAWGISTPVHDSKITHRRVSEHAFGFRFNVHSYTLMILAVLLTVPFMVNSGKTVFRDLLGEKYIDKASYLADNTPKRD